jgi:hypothetical protein
MGKWENEDIFRSIWAAMGDKKSSVFAFDFGHWGISIGKAGEGELAAG